MCNLLWTSLTVANSLDLECEALGNAAKTDVTTIHIFRMCNTNLIIKFLIQMHLAIIDCKFTVKIDLLI